MPVVPTAPRNTVEEFGDSLNFSIPSRKQWFPILFLPLWLAGWAFGEFSVLGPILAGRGFGGPGPFILVWLAGWTAGGAFVLYALLWQLVGRETVVVSSQSLIVRREIFTTLRSKEYLAEDISDMRVSPVAFTPYGWSASMAFWGLGAGGWANCVRLRCADRPFWDWARRGRGEDDHIRD